MTSEVMQHSKIHSCKKRQIILKNAVLMFFCLKIKNVKSAYSRTVTVTSNYSRTEESKVNHLHMLDTANVNKDDLTKEFQVCAFST